MLVRFSKLFCFCLLLTLHAKGQTDWSSFKWGHDSVTVNNQKAFVQRSALFMPVSFEGDPRRYYLQLDLSSDIPILLYGTPSSIDNKLVDNKPYFINELNKCYRVNYTLKGKMGEDAFTLDSAQYSLMRKKTDTSTSYNHPTTSSAIIGTIGLRYFLKKVLIVDFTHQQFQVKNDTASIPYRFKKNKFYVPTHVANSKLIVPIDYADTTFNDVFYETGSSIFDLVVSKKIWCKLTGRTGKEADNFIVKVNSWGNELTAIGAHAKLPIRVSNNILPTAMVFYLKDDEDFYKTYGTHGMIGNTPFFSKVIVLDFITNRFGVFTAI